MDSLEQKLTELETSATAKRGRGRPPKNGIPKTKENSTESTDQVEETRTVIIDPVLSPYKIIVGEHSFNVVDEVRPVGAIADNPYAYCSSLDNALLKIAKLKTVKNKTYSLKSYIDEWRQLIQLVRDTVKTE